MRKIFTILLATVSSFTNGQSFLLNPDDTLEITTNFNQFGIYDIYQENLINDTIHLAWTPVLVDIPSGWDYSMCDLGHCYTGIPGGSMYPLPPSEMAFLGLNINPMNISGIATVHVYVYDVNFPSQGDTATWIVKTADLVSINEISNEPFSIFPNPAVDMITIHVNEELPGISVELMDISGRVLISNNYSSANISLDVSPFPSGVYFVKVISGERTFIKKLIHH